MLLTRRALLVAGGAVAAATGLGVPITHLPAPARGLRLFSEGEVGLIAALGEAFFPPGNPLGASAADVDLPALLDALIFDLLDPVVGPVFRYLLRGFALGTLASRQAPFESLSLEDRREVLANWADNDVLPRRMAYDTFKTLLGMAFFNTPESRAAVGVEAGACHLGAA